MEFLIREIMGKHGNFPSQCALSGFVRAAPADWLFYLFWLRYIEPNLKKLALAA